MRTPALRGLTVAELRVVGEVIGVPLETSMRKDLLSILRGVLFGEPARPQGELDPTEGAAGENEQADLSHKGTQEQNAIQSRGEINVNPDYRLLELQLWREELQLKRVQIQEKEQTERLWLQIRLGELNINNNSSSSSGDRNSFDITRAVRLMPTFSEDDVDK